MGECLGEDTILSLVQDDLDGSRRATVNEHLDECDACRELVALAVRSNSTADLNDDSQEPVPTARYLTRGAEVDRYVVLDLLGAGGMGAVYAAYDPELDRKIALKLVLPDGSNSATRTLRANYMRREAQAMARVRHPNVATVHDTGTFDDHVFIAMEFVDGGTLREWLRREERPWRAVLDLFTAAGAGLAAAHAAGLVHRDFKPDNVLLGTDGQVCVTDFGLARSSLAEGATPPPGPIDEGVELSGDSQGMSARLLVTPLTRTGAVVGTPAYMAPEQVKPGAMLDARTDQFSFAVALFEALYGRRPFGASLRESLENARAGALDIPARTSVPGWIPRALRRALSADPDERFPAMDDLLSALDWRARRRRRSIVAAVGIVAAGLSVFWLLPATAADPCAAARKELEGVWSKARRGALVAAFRRTGAPYASDASRVVGRALDGYAKSWTDARVRLCRATAGRRERRAGGIELGQTCLRKRRDELRSLTDLFLRAKKQTVARAVNASYRLTPVGECEDLEALRAEQAGLPKDRERRARAAKLEARLITASSLNLAGRYREALEHADAVAREAATLGAPSVEAEAQRLRGEILLIRSRVKASDLAYRRAFQLAYATRRDRLAATSLIALIHLEAAGRRRVGEARRWAEIAQPAVARAGEPAALRAALASRKGAIAYVGGEVAKAAALHRKALAIEERLRGPEHPLVARHYFNLYLALNRLGKLGEAEVSLRRSYEITLSLFGPKHPYLFRRLHSLGNLHLLRQEPRRAAEVYRKALVLREGRFPPGHRKLAISLSALGGAYIESGDLKSGERYLLRALSIERASGRETTTTHLNIALLELKRGRLEKAEEAVERTVALDRRRPDVMTKVEVASVRSRIEMKRRRFALAEKIAREGIAEGERALKKDHLLVAILRLDLAAALRGAGRLAQTAAVLDTSLETLRRSLGATHPFVVRVERRRSDLKMKEQPPREGVRGPARGG